MLLAERIVALRQVTECCRKDGTVAVMSVFGSLVDKFPMGAVMNKSLTVRAGQQHGQRYAERLFGHIERGEMDPSPLLTHPLPLAKGPRGYDLFRNKEGCLRAVFTPWSAARPSDGAPRSIGVEVWIDVLED
ncbi:MAG: hypothetical protein JO157_13355 [Acetobacteraceae bacterium]|nr:hypothetical protein [Acetobacteraceae bacterium]